MHQTLIAWRGLAQRPSDGNESLRQGDLADLDTAVPSVRTRGRVWSLDLGLFVLRIRVKDVVPPGGFPGNSELLPALGSFGHLVVRYEMPAGDVPDHSAMESFFGTLKKCVYEKDYRTGEQAEADWAATSSGPKIPCDQTQRLVTAARLTMNWKLPTLGRCQGEWGVPRRVASVRCAAFLMEGLA